jgi:hypothetical protein
MMAALMTPLLCEPRSLYGSMMAAHHSTELCVVTEGADNRALAATRECLNTRAMRPRV